MKTIIRISLDTIKHKDVIDVIMACPKPFRTEYIVEAIRYTRRNLIPQQQENENNKRVDFKKIW